MRTRREKGITGSVRSWTCQQSSIASSVGAIHRSYEASVVPNVAITEELAGWCRALAVADDLP